MTDPRPACPDLDPALADLLGQTVVLDTAGSVLYLGELSAIGPTVFTLVNADVHDCAEGSAGKELYVLDARRLGVRPNRRSVVVFRSAVLSLSPLAEVVVD